MASFFLIINKSDKEETGNILNDSLESFNDRFSWIFASNRIGIAIESSAADHPVADEPGSFKQDGFCTDKESGCMIISDSRIDYRRELTGKLSLDLNEAEGYSDSKLILLAYLKWGASCLSQLYGDFTFIIWDPSRDELLCARDHFGCRSLYYMDQPGFLALASQVSAFENLPGFSLEIREQYILDTICSIVKNETLSAYVGIRRLKPAHYLKQIKGQLSAQVRYWDLRHIEPFVGLTLEEASDGLRNRFIEAVRQRSKSHGEIGVELSGGLDSSGIAAVLTMLAGQNVKINAFTHAMPAAGMAPEMDQKGEMEFSAALLEKAGAIRQFQITGEHSEGVYSALLKALTRLRKPVNLHYAMNSDLLFETAANAGTTLMFSGLGGDEGITFSGSGYFNELIHQGQHLKLRNQIRSLASRRGKPFWWQLIRVYLDYYTPWALDFFKKDWRRTAFRSTAIQKSLARKYRMKHRFMSTYFFPDKADVREMQHFRLLYPNIPERIEATSLLAQQHGIEYRYPFLDVKLLEFFYALPSDFKYKDGMGRFLFRLAMETLLPEKIRMRTDKGGNTIPYVFDRLLKDEGQFRKLIDEGRSQNQYHYLDYDKLHAMLNSFKKPGVQAERDFGIREFQSAMSVLILQKWQREGKTDTGIKC